MSFMSFWVHFLGVVVVASILLGLALIPISLILNWEMEWWNKRCEKKDRQSAMAQKEQELAEREKALEEKEQALTELEKKLTKKTPAEQEEPIKEPTEPIKKQMVLYAANERHNAQDGGIEYVFDQDESDEREKIIERVKEKSARGFYIVELDFPVSERSVKWLEHGGFQVSQAEGKILVFWGNAKV